MAERAFDRNGLGGWLSFKQGKPCLVIELVCYQKTGLFYSDFAVALKAEL